MRPLITPSTLLPSPTAAAPAVDSRTMDNAAIPTAGVGPGERLMLTAPSEARGMQTGVFAHALGTTVDASVCVDGTPVMQAITAQ